MPVDETPVIRIRGTTPPMVPRPTTLAFLRNTGSLLHHPARPETP
jgi:hypothetical protein